jgi:hypothetical protein
MLVNLITEIVYLFIHNFETDTIFYCYFFVCILKAIVPSVIAIVNLKRFVIGKLSIELSSI